MSPLKIFQASCDDKKQGIVAVLSSDPDRSKSQPSSLRRTLSADMSSHKWISQMKNVASCQEFGLWDSIQEREKKKKKTEEDKTEDKTDSADIWGSVIKSRKDFNANPYVPPRPMGKCLSEKSLEICTESLGSETGSDGFSSYPSSENGDSDEEEFEVEDQGKPVKYSYKKSPPRRSFPPPLPTLSGPDGELVRMQPRRDNGRLVLEAMSVPSQSTFSAQRQDGRLVLTLVNRKPINEIKEEQKKIENSSQLPSGLLKSHRLASMMNSKSRVLANRNPSLPPRPKAAAAAAQPITPCAAPPTAASLNAYEYYWRSKPSSKAGAAAVNPLGQQAAAFKNSNRKVMICKNRVVNEEEQMFVMSPKGSCKEVRRTAVVWEPRCIATS
ncbi:protein FAF-like, chloroplastic [Cucurbita maxima]|uniref:Protein FAF-like, chloroplastic n=1 Tax=Cucurbita maxima TaxID=3661 RepID=A0A6J1I4Y7_CUCMA|nr:protein FAF-like, chloroplastic [Cucurbita maxima]